MERLGPAAPAPLVAETAIEDLAALRERARDRIAELFQRLSALRPDRRPATGRGFSARYVAPRPAEKAEEKAEEQATTTEATDAGAPPPEQAPRPRIRAAAPAAAPLVNTLDFDIEIPEPLFEERAPEAAARRRRLFAAPLVVAVIAGAAVFGSAGVVSESGPDAELGLDEVDAALLANALEPPLDPLLAPAPESDWPGVEEEAALDLEDAPAPLALSLDAPPAAPVEDAVALGAISTATIVPAEPSPERPDALNGETLRRLLAERPVKCVIAFPASADHSDLDALRQAAHLAAIGAEECVEATEYDLEDAMLRRVAAAPAGDAIEINAAFSIAGDQLCHHTEGLSALVVGERMTERARSLEALLEASYAALGGAPICQRWSALAPTGDGVVYRAEAYVNGVLSEERSDPRPFILKKRGAAPTL